MARREGDGFTVEEKQALYEQALVYQGALMSTLEFITRMEWEDVIDATKITPRENKDDNSSYFQFREGGWLALLSRCVDVMQFKVKKLEEFDNEDVVIAIATALAEHTKYS